MFPIRTILHPTDFSPQSESALQLACSLAADYGAHLVILHVMPSPVILGDGVIMSAIAGDSNHVSDRLDGIPLPDPEVDVTRRPEEGKPAAEILCMAQLCQADLIVMGSHGRRGVNRLLMGSVAEAVVRAAPCPVLTVTMPVQTMPVLAAPIPIAETEREPILA